MTTFAILTPPGNPSLPLLKQALDRVFPGSNREIAPGQYVGALENVTSQFVAEAMGPSGQVGQFVVFAVAGYWGWHDSELWAFLRSRGTPT